MCLYFDFLSVDIFSSPAWRPETQTHTHAHTHCHRHRNPTNERKRPNSSLMFDCLISLTLFFSRINFSLYDPGYRSLSYSLQFSLSLSFSLFNTLFIAWLNLSTPDWQQRQEQQGDTQIQQQQPVPVLTHWALWCYELIKLMMMTIVWHSWFMTVIISILLLLSLIFQPSFSSGGVRRGVREERCLFNSLTPNMSPGEWRGESGRHCRSILIAMDDFWIEGTPFGTPAR